MFISVFKVLTKLIAVNKNCGIIFIYLILNGVIAYKSNNFDRIMALRSAPGRFVISFS